MSSWSVYQPLFNQVLRIFKQRLRQDKEYSIQLLGRPVNKVPVKAVEEACWRQLFRGQLLANAGVTFAVAYDEWLWQQEGRHVLFPLPGLLPRLFRARMDVTVDELQTPFPAFILALPAAEQFAGVTPASCLVVCCSRSDKERYFRKLQHLSGGTTVLYDNRGNLDERTLFLSLTDKQEGGTILRWSVPFSLMGPLLNCKPDATEDMQSLLGVFDIPGVKALSEEENRLQFRLLKLVVNLCVYTKACPDALRDGIPPAATNLLPHFSVGTELGGKHLAQERNGPIGHWREWHFRRYPLKADGTRRSGAVFVTGSWVAGQAETHVVTI